nr:hypothetical protein [Mycobacterium lepromatosis]
MVEDHLTFPGTLATAAVVIIPNIDSVVFDGDYTPVTDAKVGDIWSHHQGADAAGCRY